MTPEVYRAAMRRERAYWVRCAWGHREAARVYDEKWPETADACRRWQRIARKRARDYKRKEQQ